MSDDDLRDLLHDRVDDLTTTDLAAGAWEQAGRRRRTRLLVGAGSAALAVVVLAGGLAVARDGLREEPHLMPGPIVSPATPATTPTTTPDASVGGAEVWFSPDSAGEDALPWVDGDLMPRRLDLDAVALSVEDAPISRAVLAVGVYGGSRDDSLVDRMLLWGPDGYRTLMLPSLAEPTDWMLAQDGRSLHVGTSTYVFDDRQWYAERRADPGGRQVRVPAQVADSDPYGPVRVDPTRRWVARAYGMGPGLPDPAGGTNGPESIAVVPLQGAGPMFLAISAPPPGLDGRWLQCCPVAGWLDAETLVYEARGSRPKLLAWTVGTGDVRLVSRIVGLGESEAYTASFAALSGS